MVSYKLMLSKLLSRIPSLHISDDISLPRSPYRATPQRTLSSPVFSSPKNNLDEQTPPRRPRVLVRRPQSSNYGSLGRSRTIFMRRRATAPRPRTQVSITPPAAQLLDDNTYVVLQPSSSSSSSSSDHFTRSSSPTTVPRSPPVLSESCDIDLLLSNEPEDAKKAIIKRLEGLTLALDMVEPRDGNSHAKTIKRKPTITFDESSTEAPTHAALILSPIEHWEDEDDAMIANQFSSHYPPSPVEGDTASSSQLHFNTTRSASTLSSRASSNIGSPRLPLTQILMTPAQYPHSFHLEPIPQLTLDICKSTPPPVFPTSDITTHTKLIPVENTVASWDVDQYQQSPYEVVI